MRPAVSQRRDNGLGKAHLLCERLAVLGCFLRRRENDDLARAVGERREQDVDSDRSGMMHFEGNDARGQPPPAARELGDQPAAVAAVMQQQAGVLAARLRVDRNQAFQPRAEVRHPRISVGHRARRTDGGAAAAAHAQVRIDFDVIAVR